jgi:hypothetical protein
MNFQNQCFLGTLVATILCLPGFAQTGEISGVVRDSSFAVLPDATITATNRDTGTERTTRTNRMGYYVLSFLPPGEYDVHAEADRFQLLKYTRVILDVADSTRLDFTMQVATGKQFLTVTGDVLNTESESTALGTTVDGYLIANLPLNGRTFQPLIFLVPGVVPTSGDGQFSVNGQRDDANYFTIDGVSANVGISAFRALEETAGGTVPAFNVLGATSNLAPLDAIQEFRVQTSSFSAEFGRTPGAQVQIATRSGTNEFHGGIFDYFRNDALDANDWFANAYGLPKAPLRQNDFGVTFGGPVIRNQTFFFLSYEGLRLRQPQFGTVEVPSASARAQAPDAIAQLLKAFPVPNGPTDPFSMTALFTTSYSNPSSSDAGAVRIDHAVSSKLSLFARYSDAVSVQESRADSLTHVISNHVDTSLITIGATFAPTSALVNNLRINYTRNQASHYNRLDNLGGAIPPPDSLLFPAPFASLGSSRFIFFDFAEGLRLVAGRSSDHVQRQLNFVDGVSVLHGLHGFKFGIDYRHLSPRFGPQDYGQQIGYQTLIDAVVGKTPIVPIFAFDNLTFAFHNLSVYAQDIWRPAARLTVAYGLRWEFNPAPTAKGNQKLYTFSQIDNLGNARVAPAGTPLYRSTRANFAPRFGIAYQLSPHAGNETVVKAGFGVFYDLGTGIAGESADSFPHFRRRTVTGVPFPLNGAAAPPPPANIDPPYRGQAFVVFDPHLALPRTYEWNVTLEQSLGNNQTLSASYVGAAGRKLLSVDSLAGSSPNFDSGSTISLTTNASRSDYNAAQLQFQRRFSSSLKTLVSYSWSHSLDTASSDVGGQIPARDVSPELNRGPSDFDVRHSINGAVAYELLRGKPNANPLLRHWSLETNISARTATPVDVTVTRQFGIDTVTARPDSVQGQPFYLKDPTVAGGRRFNPSAFVVPVAQRQGTLGRNALRGFPLNQWDLSISRTLYLTETMNLGLRVDAFNVLNHPNFADPVGDLGSFGPPLFPNRLFGVSTQMANTAFNGITNGLSPLFRLGGVRSLQLSLRYGF